MVVVVAVGVVVEVVVVLVVAVVVARGLSWIPAATVRISFRRMFEV